MHDLIERVATQAGLESDVAEKAVGIILGMFKEHGDASGVADLLAAMPGAEQLIANASASGGEGGGGLMSGLSGMMGGNPLMDTLGKLQGVGVDMGQARMIGGEIASYARDKAGDEVVNSVANSIPGLAGML